MIGWALIPGQIVTVRRVNHVSAVFGETHRRDTWIVYSVIWETWENFCRWRISAVILNVCFKLIYSVAAHLHDRLAVGIFIWKYLRRASLPFLSFFFYIWNDTRDGCRVLDILKTNYSVVVRFLTIRLAVDISIQKYLRGASLCRFSFSFFFPLTVSKIIYGGCWVLIKRRINSSLNLRSNRAARSDRRPPWITSPTGINQRRSIKGS